MYFNIIRKIFIFMLITFPVLLIGQHSNEYLGAENCVCHSTVIDMWAETKHAVAYDSVGVIQDNDHCLPCHTTGWDTTENAIPGGFDDFYYAEDQDGIDKMKNVQCESCHTPTDGAPEVTYAAENCGACHDGSHHPTYSDWEKSLHAVSRETSRPEIFGWIDEDPGCAGCHTAEGFIQFIEQSELEPNVDAPGDAGADITCAACHATHDGSIEGQLRMDKTELCSKCHNPEYNPESPPEPDGSAVHHSTAYMFEGKGGYEYDGYTYESSLHTNVITDKCVACHVFMTPFEEGPPEVPAYTGHTFDPHLESCVDCHGDFEVADSSFDYRGVQTEIDSLMNVLHEELAMASSADSTTDAFYRAKFNYEFVYADGSHGIHNTAYAEGLLTSSIDNFEPSALEPVEGVMPEAFALQQNYPNPFNPVTTIGFNIRNAGKVTLTIYNSVGQRIKTLVDESMNAGQYEVKFNGQQLSSGVYFYRIEVSDEGQMIFQKTHKMILMK
ncbi:MAG: T9SS type A sorting domain-containing protein [Caldithrix sp.]|nr:T9SS type A sorting domain-containing protein [Caldithrix sp.]